MALLPPQYLDTVVAIGVGDDPTKRQWIGTGFLYGRRVPKVPTSTYNVWLITNKHVLEGLKVVYLKFNSAAEPKSKDYEVPLFARNGRRLWVGHHDAERDVAAIMVPVRMLREDQRHFTYFQSDQNVADSETLRAEGITEGDRVFVLGFPMGLVATGRQYVICRGGVVARVRDLVDRTASDFMVDATVFPGNSGGPVIRCPSALAITGTTAVSRADLIGVVKSYVPYRDLAVSSQTRTPRIVFEENSGLALVESADTIIETVRLAQRRLSSRLAQARHRARKWAQAVVATEKLGAQTSAESSEPPATRVVRRAR